MPQKIDTEWLDRKEYPFISHYFSLPMGNLHYVDEGEGQPIVFLHGNPGWSFEYRHLIKSLSRTNRCIAPDLIGFGLSDKPPQWDYLPFSHAGYLKYFLDHLDLKNITFVVSDWGGPIGLSYVLHYPEKIQKLVLLNTWCWPLVSDPWFRQFSRFNKGVVGRFLIQHLQIFGKLLVRQAIGKEYKLTKQVHRHYYKHQKTPQDRKGCYVFANEMMASSFWLLQLWQQIEKLHLIPTTIIWGLKDIAFKEKELQRWNSGLPHARIVRLEKVGHFPQEEVPDVIIRKLVTGNQHKNYSLLPKGNWKEF